MSTSQLKETNQLKEGLRDIKGEDIPGGMRPRFKDTKPGYIIPKT